MNGLIPRKITAALLDQLAPVEVTTRGKRFLCADDFFEHYGPLLNGRRKEFFLTAALDSKHRLIGEEVVSVGSLTESVVHPREVFRWAVSMGARRIGLVHNHPSDDPTPSVEDKVVTRRLVKSGRMLGIEILDHVIVADGRFFSFVDAGLCGLRSAHTKSAAPAAS